MHPDFEKDGYMVARNFFDDTTVALMQTYFDFKYRIINFSEESRGKAIKSRISVDGDIAESFNFYGDHLTESIHLNYGQKASEIVHMKLSPTYTYARIYEQGDKLIPHTDRPACEISATAPIYSHDGAPSTMYISNYKINPKLDKPRIYTLEQVESIGDYTEVNLYPGDVLFYRGCEKYHWRKPLKNKYLMQFFMHYVETDGEHSEWYFDKRPYSGFNSIHKDKASDIPKLPIII